MFDRRASHKISFLVAMGSSAWTNCEAAAHMHFA